MEDAPFLAHCSYHGLALGENHSINKKYTETDANSCFDRFSFSQGSKNELPCPEDQIIDLDRELVDKLGINSNSLRLSNLARSRQVLQCYYILDPWNKGYIDYDEALHWMMQERPNNEDLIEFLFQIVQDLVPFTSTRGVLEKETFISILLKWVNEDYSGYGIYSALRNTHNPVNKAFKNFNPSISIVSKDFYKGKKYQTNLKYNQIKKFELKEIPSIAQLKTREARLKYAKTRSEAKLENLKRELELEEKKKCPFEPKLLKTTPSTEFPQERYKSKPFKPSDVATMELYGDAASDEYKVMEVFEGDFSPKPLRLQDILRAKPVQLHAGLNIDLNFDLKDVIRFTEKSQVKESNEILKAPYTIQDEKCHNTGALPFGETRKLKLPTRTPLYRFYQKEIEYPQEKYFNSIKDIEVDPIYLPRFPKDEQIEERLDKLDASIPQIKPNQQYKWVSSLRGGYKPHGVNCGIESLTPKKRGIEEARQPCQRHLSHFEKRLMVEDVKREMKKNFKTFDKFEKTT